MSAPDSTPVGDQVLDQQWYRNSVTDAEVLQPVSAQPILAASGWFPMSKKDVTARQKAADKQRQDAEDAMRASAESSADTGDAAAQAVAADPGSDPHDTEAQTASTDDKENR